MSYLDVSAKIGRIYAQALYESAEKENKRGEVYDGLQAVLDLYRTSDEFRSFYNSPRIAREHKKVILDTILKDKVPELVRKTLGVMVDKGREPMLNNLVQAYEQYRDEAECRVHVFVTSPKPLDDETREAIRSKIAAADNDIIVEMHERVDESLLGGLRVRVRDYLVDNTIRTRLRKMRKQLQRHASAFV